MTEHNDSTGKIKDDIPGPQTPGQMVRAQRESAGLTLQAVSEALHLTVHYIKSLEADEYGKLPGLTFVKGYFRAYARFLKMDVDAVLAAYERHLAAKGFRQHTHDFTANQSMGSLGGRRSDQSFAWALVAGVILVIALAAGWWFFGREMEVAIANGSSPTPTQTTAPATTTTPAPTQPVTTTTQPLVSQQNTFGQSAASAATTTTTTPSAVTQNFSQTTTAPGVATTTVPVVNPADTNAQTAAADVGVAVINATLEARQEEALLAEQAAAESAAAEAGEVIEGVAETAPAAVNSAVATATTTAANTATATGGAVPLSSYTAPVSNNTAASTDADVQTAAALNTAATTTTSNGAEIVTGTSGTRNITLRGNGNDRLEIRLSGNSWAEIRDGQGANLYSAMLREGDNLVVEGAAPFAVLLGDARQAEASFNAQRIDMSSLIRSDNTARFRLGAEGVTAILREQTVVTE